MPTTSTGAPALLGSTVSTWFTCKYSTCKEHKQDIDIDIDICVPIY